jgi:hypothetical protein
MKTKYWCSQREAIDETLQNRTICAFHGSKCLTIDAVAPSFRIE